MIPLDLPASARGTPSAPTPGRPTRSVARFLGWLFLLSATPVASQPVEHPLVLHDVTAESGIHFRHTDGSSGRYYMIEYVSAGLALFDYDGDGDVDIFFLNGAPHPGTPVTEPPRDALYRNDGGWRFTDVTERAGVGDTGHGLGVTVGDYDGDGDPDLYLNNLGPNLLYRNKEATTVFIHAFDPVKVPVAACDNLDKIIIIHVCDGRGCLGIHLGCFGKTFRTASRRTKVPKTLVFMKALGSSMDRSTWDSAAKLTIASMPLPTNSSMRAASTMSPRMKW